MKKVSKPAQPRNDQPPVVISIRRLDKKETTGLPCSGNGAS